MGFDESPRFVVLQKCRMHQIKLVRLDSTCRRSKGERGIWQRRFWEHLITDEEDLSRHFDYIHINPVKHGHARRAADWPYSSIHRYIRAGWMTADWAADPEHVSVETGERNQPFEE